MDTSTTLLPAQNLPINDSETRRDQTREQILRAARVALTEVGYERITTRRIAEAAGVNIATLHYHFGSKEALLKATIQGALLRTEGLLREAMAGAENVPQMLERAMRAILRIASERPGMLRFDLAVRGFRDKAARDEANALYDIYRRLMMEVVERHLQDGGRLIAGFTAPQVAHFLVAAVDGIMLQHTLTGDEAAVQNDLEMLRQNALALLLPTSEDNKPLV